MHKLLSSLAVLALSLTGVVSQDPDRRDCKCVPGDSCWPPDAAWQQLNHDVDGNLIRTQPIAQSCYPGSLQNLADCSYVVTEWPVQDFQTSDPIGRVLPWNVTCPPVDYQADQVPSTCTLGINPVYAVNATTKSDILSTLRFAREHNIRLTVTGTGHDLLGRSDGYGSLEVWLRYYRNKIEFQEKFPSAAQCAHTNWTGSAIHIDGNYQWRDVSAVARANNHIVATGGSISVGAIGGWPSGGGHGPATQFLGFGADQVLEAEVMQADGRTVIANACQNSDLYRAIRGGGPGYGVVLGMTVKAHPNVPIVTAHHLSIVPRIATANNSALLDAVSVILQMYPDLIDAGVGGYTYWYSHNAVPVVGNSTSGYKHGVWTIGRGEDVARAALDPFVSRLRSQFNGSLLIAEDYVTYKDYWSFYDSELAYYDMQGDTLIMTSRIVEREQVSPSRGAAIRRAVETISYAPGQTNSNVVLLVGGGQVARDVADPYSGLNPAWRRAAYAVVTVRDVKLHTSNEDRLAAQKDMLAKGAAMKKLAPDTGAYLNEADRNDPDYIRDFYGENYAAHLAVKHKYDPGHLFYCPTCVGSEEFVELSEGPLCRRA